MPNCSCSFASTCASSHLQPSSSTVLVDRSIKTVLNERVDVLPVENIVNFGASFIPHDVVEPICVSDTDTYDGSIAAPYLYCARIPTSSIASLPPRLALVANSGFGSTGGASIAASGCPVTPASGSSPVPPPPQATRRRKTDAAFMPDQTSEPCGMGSFCGMRKIQRRILLKRRRQGR